MNLFKKLALCSALAAAVAAMSLTSMAATVKTPADIIADLTGSTAESVLAQRNESGKSFGTIASDAGKLSAFKTELLAQRKALLEEQVVSGLITQAQADAAYTRLVEYQANCDGTGTGCGHASGTCGICTGVATGTGLGLGCGNGAGVGNGTGNGGHHGGRGGRGGCRS